MMPFDMQAEELSRERANSQDTANKDFSFIQNKRVPSPLCDNYACHSSAENNSRNHNRNNTSDCGFYNNLQQSGATASTRNNNRVSHVNGNSLSSKNVLLLTEDNHVMVSRASHPLITSGSNIEDNDNPSQKSL